MFLPQVQNLTVLIVLKYRGVICDEASDIHGTFDVCIVTVRMEEHVSSPFACVHVYGRVLRCQR